MRIAGMLAVVLVACSSSTPTAGDAQAPADVADGSSDASEVAVVDAPEVDAPRADVVVAVDAVDAPTPDLGELADVVDAGAPIDSGPGCVDRDQDTFGVGCAAGPDCDDTDGARHPGARELCDGVDQNCDGLADVLADAGAAPYDPAVTPRCEELMPPTPGRPWAAGGTPVCVLPSMPPAFARCRAPASAPTCIACRGTGAARECILRGELSSGSCIPL